MKNAVEVLNNLNLTAAELAELIHCNNYLSLVANEEGDYLLCSSKEEEYMEHKNGYEYVGTLKEGACECQYCEEGAEPTFDTPELKNEALWVLEEALNETVMA